ncbi:MAG: hypothetical protein WBP56_08220 [Polyangia bacterium]
MPTVADIERRVLAASSEPTETAEMRKGALLDVIRVFGRGGEWFAISEVKQPQQKERK